MSEVETTSSLATDPVSHIRHLQDIYFTVVAVARDYKVDFTVYDVVGFCEGATKAVYDQPMWHKIGATDSMDSVETLEEAEIFLHGQIKWDGCADWYFDEQDRVMLHTCARAGLERYSAVMLYCYDMTRELLPDFNDN